MPRLAGCQGNPQQHLAIQQTVLHSMSTRSLNCSLHCHCGCFFLPVQLEKAGMTPGLRAMGDKLYSLDELEVRPGA